MMNFGQFPLTRLRRCRQAKWIRDLNTETSLNVKDLIWPIFIRESQTPSHMDAMPGITRFTLAELEKAVEHACELGIPALALFPYTPFEKRTPNGQEAFNPNNLICQAIRLIKEKNYDIGLITDVALDPYTTHGHDGLLKNNQICNDETVDILVQQALNQAQAGSDVIAPSDMMDGRIKTIREKLDANGFQHIILLSYAAKYASAFYGPFREAVGVTTYEGPQDKKTYQMNPANKREALQEVAQDIQEGADMVLVKPGLPYLDVIQAIHQTFLLPVYAYQVSGEYAMIKAAAQNGWINQEAVMMESLIALKRAGASGIFTYAALDVATCLKT